MVRQLAKRSGNGLRSFSNPYSLRRELDELIQRMWGGEAEWLGTDTAAPSMDLSETDNGYQARVDLPGVSAEDIDIQVNGNVLTITGERHDEKEEEGRTFHRTERSYGSFARSVTLPCDVMEDEVAASLGGGFDSVPRLGLHHRPLFLFGGMNCRGPLFGNLLLDNSTWPATIKV